MRKFSSFSNIFSMGRCYAGSCRMRNSCECIVSGEENSYLVHEIVVTVCAGVETERAINEQSHFQSVSNLLTLL